MNWTDRIFHRIASLVINHRLGLTIGASALLIGAIFLSTRAPMRLNMGDFLPDVSSAEDSLDVLLASRFGSAGRLVIYVESDQEMNILEVGPIIDELAARLAALDDVASVQKQLDPGIRKYLDEQGPRRILLHMRIPILELVAERLSRGAIEQALVSASDTTQAPALFFSDIVERDPLKLAVLAGRQLYEIAGSSPIRIEDGYFSLPGKKIFFLVMEPANGMDDLSNAGVLVDEIENVIESVSSHPSLRQVMQGKRISAIGRAVSYYYAAQAVINDVKRVGGLVVIAVVVLLIVFFRTIWAPVVVLMPVLFGLSIAGATAYLAFGTISVIAWIFVGLLIGLGVDFSLHLAVQYRMHSEDPSDKERSLATALSRPGPAIITAGLTTAAGFFALGILSYPVMKQVAVLTGVGLLGMLLSALIVLPVCLSHFPPGAKSDLFFSTWASRLARSGIRRPSRSLLLWVTILIVAAVAATSIPFEPHPWKLALDGNPKTAELDRLNQALGSSFTPLLVLSRGETREDVIAADRRAVDLFRRGAERAGIVTIESLSNWLPSEQDQKDRIEYIAQRSDLFSPSRFLSDYNAAFESASYDSAGQDLESYLRRGYPENIARFLNTDLRVFDVDNLEDDGLSSQIDKHIFDIGSGYVAISYIYLRRFPWAKGSIDRFLDTYNQLGGGQLENVSLVGEAMQSARHSSILRRDLLAALILTLGLVMAIVLAHFRNLTLAGLSMVPAIFGIVVAIIAMSVLKLELNLLTLSIVPLIIGMGVDDGIHIVHRLRSGMHLDQAMAESGSAMTMTTLTTVAALACFGFATFDGIKELGLVGAAGLVACLLASIHLVPVCYRMWGPKKAGLESFENP